MKERTKWYPLYKKLRKTPLEKHITETTEFKTFAEIFPHMAESLRLSREIQRLRQMLKSTEDRTTRLRRKREVNHIRGRLSQERILKQLHGESKQESLFRIRYRLDVIREATTSTARRARTDIRKTITSVSIRQRRIMRRNLPPSIFDLKSLLVSEKGLALKEWVRKHQSKLAKP